MKSEIRCLVEIRSELGEGPVWSEAEQALYWIDCEKPAAYRYDPAANQWTMLAPLPAVRNGASAVSNGTYLYILGGSFGSTHTQTLYRYDPATNSYTLLAPIPRGATQSARHRRSPLGWRGHVKRVSTVSRSAGSRTTMSLPSE